MYPLHISSDISALWAECHIPPCLYIRGYGIAVYLSTISRCWFPRISIMYPLPGTGQARTHVFSQIFRLFGQNVTFLPAYTYTIR
jgi:hypothetical protein